MVNDYGMETSQLKWPVHKKLEAILALDPHFKVYTRKDREGKRQRAIRTNIWLCNGEVQRLYRYDFEGPTVITTFWETITTFSLCEGRICCGDQYIFDIDAGGFRQLTEDEIAESDKVARLYLELYPNYLMAKHMVPDTDSEVDLECAGYTEESDPAYIESQEIYLADPAHATFAASHYASLKRYADATKNDEKEMFEAARLSIIRETAPLQYAKEMLSKIRQGGNVSARLRPWWLNALKVLGIVCLWFIGLIILITGLGLWRRSHDSSKRS